MRQYFNSTRSILYSLILTAPLLGIYELGINLIFKDSFYEVRNTGDIMLRKMGQLLHLENPWILSVALIAVFTTYMIIASRREILPPIRSVYFPAMLAESILWGSVMFVILTLLSSLPLQLDGFATRMARYNLALGAGVYEELVFRAILVPAILVVFRRGFGFNDGVAQTLAVIGTALIFASFHLLMEQFVLLVYIQRFAGGLILAILFLKRGYGIAVYSHVTFNLLTLILTEF